MSSKRNESFPTLTVWLMEGHPWIFTWELHQHLIPYQRDGLNSSKATRQMDMKQQHPSICFISVGNERNYHQINCSFHHSPAHSGEEKDPRWNNLESGLECVSPALSSFFPLFQSSFPVPPASRAWEDVPWSRRERGGLNLSSVQRLSSTLTCSHGIQFQALVGKFSKSSHLGIKSLWKSCSEPIVLRISKILQCFMVDHMETFMCSSL